MGRSPARPLGRHHLHPADARSFVAAARVRPGELVLDLGAGHGALTAPLAAAGARVLAVEVDRRALAALRARFDGTTAVTVLAADLRELRLPGRPFRVVANLPFAATAVTLRRLLDPSALLTRADLIVQRGAAVAWASEPRRRSPAARRAFDLHLGPVIRADRFDPPPGVDAAVLTVTRRRPGPPARRRRTHR